MTNQNEIELFEKDGIMMVKTADGQAFTLAEVMRANYPDTAFDDVTGAPVADLEQGTIEERPPFSLKEWLWQKSIPLVGLQGADAIIGRKKGAEGAGISALDFAGGGILDAIDLSNTRSAQGKKAFEDFGLDEGMTYGFGALEAAAPFSKPVFAAIGRGAKALRGKKPKDGVKVPKDVEKLGNLILSNLKSGKYEQANNLLDTGDALKNTQLNQYLFANYDLPMDEASRMARAEQMQRTRGGFHGVPEQSSAAKAAGLTPRALPTFTGEGAPDVNNLIPSTYGKTGRGVYVDAMPTAETAQDFAGAGGVIIPLLNKSGDYLPYQEFRNTWKSLEGIKPNQYVSDLDLARNKANDLAEEAGFLGVNNDYFDFAPEYTVYNPANVRSRFARFDPRLSFSKNLLAGIGGATAIGGSYGLLNTRSPNRRNGLLEY